MYDTGLGRDLSQAGRHAGKARNSTAIEGGGERGCTEHAGVIRGHGMGTATNLYMAPSSVCQQHTYSTYVHTYHGGDGEHPHSR